MSISGSIHCPNCNDTDKNKPELKLHIIKSGAIKFDNFEKTTQTDLTLKFRDADSLTLIDSYFEQMNSSTIEVFNIPTVYIMHSEFHHSSPNVIGKPTQCGNFRIFLSFRSYVKSNK